jgi:hypothetical protein
MGSRSRLFIHRHFFHPAPSKRARNRALSTLEAGRRKLVRNAGYRPEFAPADSRKCAGGLHSQSSLDRGRMLLGSAIWNKNSFFRTFEAGMLLKTNEA